MDFRKKKYLSRVSFGNKMRHMKNIKIGKKNTTNFDKKMPSI